MRGGSTSSSSQQRSHLGELVFECQHFRGVGIRGAGKAHRSLGIDHPGRVGLVFIDGFVIILSLTNRRPHNKMEKSTVTKLLSTTAIIIPYESIKV
jgi:hypothetical protein